MRLRHASRWRRDGGAGAQRGQGDIAGQAASAHVGAKHASPEPMVGKHDDGRASPLQRGANAIVLWATLAVHSIKQFGLCSRDGFVVIIRPY